MSDLNIAEVCKVRTVMNLSCLRCEYYHGECEEFKDRRKVNKPYEFYDKVREEKTLKKRRLNLWH